MHGRKFATWAMAAAIGIAASLVAGYGSAAAAEAAKTPPAEQQEPPKFENDTCLGCHGNEGFSGPTPDGKTRSLHVVKDKFQASVHGKRLCVECHTNITEIPHKPGTEVRVSCVKCHEDLWARAKKENKTDQFARLGVVVQQIDKYMASIHARPSIEDQSRTNATCYNCHDAHYVYPKGSAGRTEWRLTIPNVCGKCHASERDAYVTSVHGKEVLEKKNPKAAICSDCHTTHDIADPAIASTRLVITKNCGNCHEENLKTYTGTYHGQVNTLGYAYTAKCFDCHGSHAIQRVADAKSMVHPNNRLNTCRQCHANATDGFLTFKPHGNTHDFQRYPYLWVASKFMIALLIGVFAFFWLSIVLWFYREYKERKERKSVPHVLTEELKQFKGKYYQRFPLVWRIAHLTLIFAVMLLVLTGMAVFYAETNWAKNIMNFLGGPKAAAIIHRVCAVVFVTIFVSQLVYFVMRIAKNWKTFDWFGPTSLVPRWQDLYDCQGMFRWFFGKGPRPQFDRWTYWEKFDYWAVFWGVAIIGSSGLMMWFPSATAAILPGWVFNVAMIVHGEEAFLATVFLFTVHFFNNHFRPDKYPPPDIVMFTGAVSLEEFRREHTLEYKRLVESGEISKYLVDVPSRPMTIGSRILGIALLIFGLALLTFVLIGFIGSMKG